MSFEDGGDLASFAAIAESTIVNKEGKHRRVLSATILQNYSLTEQANASLAPCSSWRAFLHRIPRKSFLKTHHFLRQGLTMFRTLSFCKLNEKLCCFPGPSPYSRKQVFPRNVALWRSPQTSFYEKYPFPNLSSILQTHQVGPLGVWICGGKIAVVLPRPYWFNFVTNGVDEGCFFPSIWCHI